MGDSGPSAAAAADARRGPYTRRYCKVPGCKSNSIQNPKMSFFRLPTNKTRAAVWLSRTQIPPPERGENVVICGDHFQPECMNLVSKRVRLLPAALPSLRLPTQPAAAAAIQVNLLLNCGPEPRHAAAVETYTIDLDARPTEIPLHPLMPGSVYKRKAAQGPSKPLNLNLTLSLSEDTGAKVRKFNEHENIPVLSRKDKTDKNPEDNSPDLSFEEKARDERSSDQPSTTEDMVPDRSPFEPIPDENSTVKSELESFEESLTIEENEIIFKNIKIEDIHTTENQEILIHTTDMSFQKQQSEEVFPIETQTKSDKTNNTIQNSFGDYDDKSIVQKEIIQSGSTTNISILEGELLKNDSERDTALNTIKKEYFNDNRTIMKSIDDAPFFNNSVVDDNKLILKKLLQQSDLEISYSKKSFEEKLTQSCNDTRPSDLAHDSSALEVILIESPDNIVDGGINNGQAASIVVKSEPCDDDTSAAPTLANNKLDEEDIPLASLLSIKKETIKTENLITPDESGECTDDARGWRAGPARAPRREAFRPQPTRPTPCFNCPYEAFRCFWDDDILNRIVEHTNRNGKKKVNMWIDTNKHEILVLFAFWMLLGVRKMPTYESCFSPDPLLSTEVFIKLIRKQRYKELLQTFCFTDDVEEHATKPCQNVTLLDPIVEHLNSKFQYNYTPSRNVSVHELFSEPAAAAAPALGPPPPRVVTLGVCDPTTGYVWSLFVSTDESLHNIDESVTTSNSSMLMKLLKPILKQGHTIFVDDRFTTPSLARYLKENLTDCVGLLRPSYLREEACVDVDEIGAEEVIAHSCGDAMSAVAWRAGGLVRCALSTHHAAADAHTLRAKLCADYDKWMQGQEGSRTALEPYMEEASTWQVKAFTRLLNCSVLNARILEAQGTLRDEVEFRLSVVRAIEHEELEAAAAALEAAAAGSGRALAWWLAAPPRLPGQPLRTRRREGRAHWPAPATAPASAPAPACAQCKQKAARDRLVVKCEQCDVMLCIPQCYKDFHFQFTTYTL